MNDDYYYRRREDDRRREEARRRAEEDRRREEARRRDEERRRAEEERRREENRRRDEEARRRAEENKRADQRREDNKREELQRKYAREDQEYEGKAAAERWKRAMELVRSGNTKAATILLGLNISSFDAPQTEGRKQAEAAKKAELPKPAKPSPFSNTWLKDGFPATPLWDAAVEEHKKAERAKLSKAPSLFNTPAWMDEFLVPPAEVNQEKSPETSKAPQIGASPLFDGLLPRAKETKAPPASVPSPLDKPFLLPKAGRMPLIVDSFLPPAKEEESVLQASELFLKLSLDRTRREIASLKEEERRLEAELRAAQNRAKGTADTKSLWFKK
jgi:hypothetical protein